MRNSFEVIPGVGMGDVVLGLSGRRVAELLGPAEPGSPHESFYRDGMILVEYGPEDTVRFIQVSFSLPTDPAVTIRGIRLNGRAYDDVIGDLADAGITGTETDIRHDFGGWGVFTMDSLMVLDVDPARPDDERPLQRACGSATTSERPAAEDFRPRPLGEHLQSITSSCGPACRARGR
ncbi:hypothetical protein [Gordonia phthalatica]|uniref:Uncharacterized protein n=1 Tax=Gordonia phthalatica TaxID=1136941 RepID=A0A0N9MRG4_9ACTN|nr:hypothetical protein [Gordonia phthalatica]ALG85025.1 hypothetical protein ACH46_11680 [Gordonia phthalatica]